ncbi:MAG TPA: hypothetical protein VFU22_26025 [Roseiflexaceae bacterium]|nr:hypothetical protein [Roseiflexaceae bacterium]
MSSGVSSSWRHRWIIVLALLFVAVGAVPQIGAAARAVPPTRAAAGVACKPEPTPTGTAASGSSAALCPPLPDRDDVSTARPAVKNVVEAIALPPPGDTPRPGAKGGSEGLASTQPDIAALTADTASGGSLQCGAASGGGWTTTSSTFVTIKSCTLTVPEDGVVYISATASVALKDAAFEARFNLSIDNPNGNNATDRLVDVYTDTGGDGTDKSVADTLLAPVSAGAHTDTITAAPDVPLGGAGAGNGSFTAGEVYAVGSTGFTTYLALAKR